MWRNLLLTVVNVRCRCICVALQTTANGFLSQAKRGHRFSSCEGSFDWVKFIAGISSECIDDGLLCAFLFIYLRLV
ncbi:hypothetical protein CABS01_15145 [Colletotrichum abscissum]|uniref:uncharacterized protein n=1 Tax=Colletotrichum abscissum TaxID=1671311 RepID=UPI0027D6F525|nr:uncharacterized protein CABS01_15145 [Colletotrichum abscissum]KAK1477104.1 hypothetical protein CABS01_15145 [Colletotrichum abscissum]